MANGNGSARNSSSYPTPTWQPESPFLDESDVLTQESSSVETSASPSTWHLLESPFLSIYELEGQESITDPKAEAFVSLMSELHDEEFDEAVRELINEAEDILEQRFVYEQQDVAAQARDSERLLEEHFAPLVREVEYLFERMAQGIDQQDLRSMSQGELEVFLNQYEPKDTNLSPTFEYFLKKLWKKAKQIAGKAIQVVGKITPLGPILKNLKRLVKPMVKRILQSAIGKLPAALQPLAQDLAKRFIKEVPELEAASFDRYEEPTRFETAWIQSEFDVEAVSLLLAPEETEQELFVAEFLAKSDQPVSDPIAELESARTEFINKITHLPEGEDPTPQLENFIPALLPALKLGVKLIGRKKVVNFLAKLLAKLIGRFVGEKNSTLLSQAMVDVGLRMIGFEVSPEGDREAAGSAIANTVEETVRDVAALPEYALENEALLEGCVMEAFEAAAAANFPPALLRPELRETSDVDGTWVKVKKTLYKKYSKIFDITFTPNDYKNVQTFGGETLRNCLLRQYGLSPEKKYTAKVHLYQAIPGTTLSLISKREKKVPGLGSSSVVAWSQFHPLTPEAAGIVLGKAGLGRPVSSPKFLANRNLIEVRQRFYFLEIPGVKCITWQAPGRPSVPVRANDVNLTLDFKQKQVILYIFISEANAQKIVNMWSQNAPIHAWLQILRSIVEGGLKASEQMLKQRMKIVEETYVFEQFETKDGKGLGIAVVKFVVDKVVEVIYKYLEEYLRLKQDEFRKAAQADADGVTIVVKFKDVPWLHDIKGAIMSVLRRVVKLTFLPEITIVAGFQK